MPLVRIRERTEILEKLIAVRSFVIKSLGPFGREAVSRPAKARKEVERQRQHERSVMMHIVPVPIGDTGLRRDGFQRWMRVNHAGRTVKPRIRNSPLAHAAVVVGKIFDQPLDRVVINCSYNARDTNLEIDRACFIHDCFAYCLE